MRAGMKQVFALQINFRTAQISSKPFGKIKRRRASAKLLQVIAQLFLEFRVLLRAEILLFELLQRVHQCFRDKPPAIWAEMASRIRHCGCRTHMKNLSNNPGYVEEDRSCWRSGFSSEQ